MRKCCASRALFRESKPVQAASGHHLFDRQNEDRARAEALELFESGPEDALPADRMNGDLVPGAGELEHDPFADVEPSPASAESAPKPW